MCIHLYAATKSGRNLQRYQGAQTGIRRNPEEGGHSGVLPVLPEESV